MKNLLKTPFWGNTLLLACVLLILSGIYACSNNPDPKEPPNPIKLTDITIDNAQIPLDNLGIVYVVDTNFPSIVLTYNLPISTSWDISTLILTDIVSQTTLEINSTVTNSGKSLTITPKSAITPLGTYVLKLSNTIKSLSGDTLLASQKDLNIRFKRKATASPPATFSTLTFSNLTKTAVTLNFGHNGNFGVQADGVTPAVADNPPYTVEISTDSNFSIRYEPLSAVNVIGVAPSRSIIIGGLTPNQKYYFRLVAKNTNATNNTTRSTIIALTMLSATMPATPTNLTKVSVRLC